MTGNRPIWYAAAILAAATVVAVALLATVPDRERVTPATTEIADQPTNLPPALSTSATVAAHPARGPQIQLTEPPVAPTTTILVDPCAEMSAFRVAAGLPERFDRIGWRESRCDNTAISPTGCCAGWLQLHKIIFRDHRTATGLAACDATWATIQGDTPEAKTRQMCAAAVLYSVDQYAPWKATT